MDQKRRQIALRLTPYQERHLDQLVALLDSSRQDVLTLALATLAKKHRVQVPEPSTVLAASGETQRQLELPESVPATAVQEVRRLISPHDPPGGPLSEEAAAGLLQGFKDVQEGRVSRLDLDSLPDDDEPAPPTVKPATTEAVLRWLRGLMGIKKLEGAQ